MGIEYKIQFEVPRDFSPIRLVNKLPSPIHHQTMSNSSSDHVQFIIRPCPIHHQTMSEIYNFKVEPDGFYFIDHLVDGDVASTALRLFIDEALLNSDSIRISEP